MKWALLLPTKRKQYVSLEVTVRIEDDDVATAKTVASAADDDLACRVVGVKVRERFLDINHRRHNGMRSRCWLVVSRVLLSPGMGYVSE